MRSCTPEHTGLHASKELAPTLEVTMQSTLRKPFAAAALLLCSGAALLAQPAFARDVQWVVEAPAAVAADPLREHDRDDHDGWRRGWRRDERAPRIVDLTPLPGERVGERRRTTVSARFADRASGVDLASVRLLIDGRDVTAVSRIDEDEVRFHNNLFPGRHVAEVIVRDRAGNTARRSWQFEVADHGHDRYPGDHGGGRWGWQH
jgi:hypothetical protein